MNEVTEMATYIVYGLDGDPEIPCLNVVANGVDMGLMVISVVGDGYPYWAFQTLPSAILLADQIGADFTGGPICSTDAQTNRNNIAGLYASPPATGADNNGTNKVWVEVA